MTSAQYQKSKSDWLLQVAADPNLTPVALGCAILLAHYASSKDFRATGKLTCWPSQIRLATEMNRTEDGVLRAIKRLEECGHIRTRRHGKGRGLTNLYELILQGRSDRGATRESVKGRQAEGFLREA